MWLYIGKEKEKYFYLTYIERMIWTWYFWKLASSNNAKKTPTQQKNNKGMFIYMEVK